MYRRLAVLCALPALSLYLTGCATVPTPSAKTINVSEARLQQLIGSQFPYNSRLLEILDVTASSPRIKLEQGNNRISTALDLLVAPRGVVGSLSKRELKGLLDMSYGLRFEPSDNSVRMTDVKVGKLELYGAPSNSQSIVNKIGGALAERLLKDYSLYKLSEQDLSSIKGWGYQPGAFSVGSNGLNITLNPVEKK
jgi:hypothetical protein